MPTLLGPAVVPSLAGPALLDVDAHELLAPAPIPPEPGPGDPDVEPPAPEPTPPGALRRPRAPMDVSVVVYRQISQRRIGQLVTAEVEDWSEDVELLVGSSAAVSCSPYDPLLADMATASFIGPDGRRRYDWDPGGYTLRIYVDGVAVWGGRFARPIDFGADRVLLPTWGYESALDDRMLGRVQQYDWLEGRGDFEPATGLAGWTSTPGCEFALVHADDVPGGVIRGSHALKVVGDGWVHSPAVAMPGHQGVDGRPIVGSVFGRWPDAVPAGTAVAHVYVTLGGTPVWPEVSLAESAGRPSEQGWSDDPVQAGGRMLGVADPHMVRLGLRGFPGADTFYDVARIGWPQLTGFLQPADLSDHAVQALKELNARSVGGSPTGMRSKVTAPTGVKALKVWRHAEHPSARDMFTWILEQDGAPECRVTPDGTLLIQPRLGQVRTDVRLTSDEILDARWAIDPGGRVTEFLADSGRGSGVAWVAEAVIQPLAEDQLQVTRVARGPDGWSLNDLAAWAKRHAREAAQVQVTSDVEVPWGVGAQLAVGDEVQVVFDAGGVGRVQQMRVLSKKYVPGRLVQVLGLGAS